MIIVACVSLSTMLSNNILIPYTFLGNLSNEDQVINNKKIIKIRRIGIFILIVLSYLIYRYFALNYTLVSIGLVSFAIIAQLAPAFLALYFGEEVQDKVLYGEF